ncbi:MAG: D-alanine--D-alanine ligase [Bacteroidia bacterium]|nr:MAG: D-alanine--D-alanine ligase [Bacteroidia bacterium]
MKTKVGVFFGGRSVEHEISVVSALQAIFALDTKQYEAVPIYITKDGKWYTGNELLVIDNYKNIQELLKKCKQVYMLPEFGNFQLYKTTVGLFEKNTVTAIDVAFPVLHGTFGEDGSIQGLFELIGIPYVGCDVLSSAAGMDKIAMKQILKSNAIPVVNYVWFYEKEWYQQRDQILCKIQEIGFPVIVKPANLGSSVGISTATNQEELIDAIDLAGNFAKKILVEKMISQMREINCSVLGDTEEAIPSVCEEPLKSGDILSYTDKYLSKGSSDKGMSGTQRKIPADLPKQTAEEIQQLALSTFKVLGCTGVSRVDLLIDKQNNEIFVNEINTIPGSLSFYLWEATDKTFTQLNNKLIELALKRNRERENLTISYDANIFSMGGTSLKLGNKQ